MREPDWDNQLEPLNPSEDPTVLKKYHICWTEYHEIIVDDYTEDKALVRAHDTDPYITRKNTTLQGIVEIDEKL